MNRNDFIKKCGAGLCGCGVLGLLTPLAARAEDPAAPAAAVPADVEQLKQQLDGARERFAMLLGIMGDQLDDATQNKILQSLGSQCSQPYGRVFQQVPRRPAGLPGQDQDGLGGTDRVR